MLKPPPAVASRPADHITLPGRLCPGGSQYGRGLSLTRVHAGDCCAKNRRRVSAILEALRALRRHEEAGMLGIVKR